MEQNIDISNWSKQKRMEFVKTLNNCMKDYENNIERSMDRSETAECKSLKSDNT